MMKMKWSGAQSPIGYPLSQLHLLIDDADREVRMTVADRIAPEDLEKMAGDKDYIVRLTIAKRLPKGRLFRFIRDEDLQVRKIVAERLPEVSLGLNGSMTMRLKSGASSPNG